jgi:hypothetical protein
MSNNPLTAAAENTEPSPAQNLDKNMIDISQKGKGKDQQMLLAPMIRMFRTKENPMITMINMMASHDRARQRS